MHREEVTSYLNCYKDLISFDFAAHTMNKLLILGMLFALGVGMVAVPSSADILSPLAQYNSGIPIQDIECRDSRILMETIRGAPACVYGKSVEMMQERGWTVIHEQDDSGISTAGNDILRYESETITVQSKNPVIPADVKIGTIIDGTLHARCIEAYSASLTVPRKVALDESFDVTLAFSFTGDRDAREFWEDNCNKYIHIRHPANYAISGISGGSLTQGASLVNDNYKPPIVSQGKYTTVSIDQQPITFQMSVSDPTQTVYGSGPARGFNWSNYDLSDIPLFNGGVYDYGYVGVYQFSHYHWDAPEVYTSIHDGFVTFYDEELASGQSEDAPQRVEFMPPFTNGTDSNSERLDVEIPFETIHEILQEDEIIRENYTAEEYIRALGYGDDYLRRFLEAYPQYGSQTQSFNLVLYWMLPSALAASPTNLSIVNGTIQAANTDSTVSGVYGVNVCAYDVSDDSENLDPKPIKNGSTDVCVVTDSSGNFRFNVPLTDLHGGCDAGGAAS